MSRNLPTKCPYCEADVARGITKEGGRIYACGTVADRDTMIINRRCGGVPFTEPENQMKLPGV